MTSIEIIQKIVESFKLKISQRQVLQKRAKDVWEFLTNWEVLGVKYNKASEFDPLIVLDKLCEQMALLIESESESERKSGEDIIDGLLILIDEADKPSTSAGLGEFCKLFTEKMIRLDCRKASLGLAGQTSLLQKLKESHESSPRLFTIYTLDTLNEKEILDVVNAGLDEANEKNKQRTILSADAKKLLCDISEGYPHFIQQFAYSAFEIDSDFIISEKDVSVGIYSEGGALEQLGRKFFQQQYFEQIGSEDYRKVLQVMADSPNDWLTRTEIIDISKLKKHTVDNALKSLKSKNIISVNEESKGCYRLPSKSFVAWIKALNNAPGKEI